MTIMDQVIEVSLDNSGHILIPSTLQSRLGLLPGMILVVEEGDNGGVRLSVQSEPPTLVDKGGVLVVKAEPLGDLTNITRRERDRRASNLLQLSP
jgi:bifunctional DNA-binding transcriptional regulator/antitoxin component of YhaV-PrlF toxin-antitoxin module